METDQPAPGESAEHEQREKDQLSARRQESDSVDKDVDMEVDTSKNTKSTPPEKKEDTAAPADGDDAVEY